MTAHDARQRRSVGGFTLVELMVVIAIIAALATIVGVNVLGALGEADMTTAKAQIQSFSTALTTYRIAFKKFPESGEGLEALVSNEKGKNFLNQKKVPLDPWGNPYVYTNEGNSFKIVSYGADGSPGGSDENADISSENLQGDSK